MAKLCASQPFRESEKNVNNIEDITTCADPSIWN
jgi:hypothetical protein